MKKVIIVLILNLLAAISVNAGTVGMSGQWSFIGEAITYDPSGFAVNNIPLIGDFDFSTGTVFIIEDSPFFSGLEWQSNGTLSDQLNGTYFSNQVAGCLTSCYGWEILWEITQTGDTASVLTLDTDADGIPGTVMVAGFPGFYTSD